MRGPRRWPLLVAVPAIALGIALGIAIAGCVSDRDATAPSEGGTCRLPLGGDVAGSTVIAIRDFGFSPVEVRIRAGQRVTWVNCEDATVSHTSTADAAAWSSGLLSPGQAFTQTFDAAGTFPYHCEPHPFMTGRVIVE